MLALFGELDNNIIASKNKDAWEAALRAGGNRDYTLRILPKANREGWKQQGNGVTTTIRACLLYDYSGLARKADTRLPGVSLG